MSGFTYECGCGVVQSPGDGRISQVTACPDHLTFAGVRRAFGILTRALEEAHEQLPVTPEPPRAA